MKFINYTNDGRVVVQHAALILSKLDETDTLELHTMDNAIILLKKDMTLVETRDVLQGMVRLARSMTLDALCNSDAEDKTPLVDESVDDEYEDTITIPVPLEAFGDAGLLGKDLHIQVIDGAVVITEDTDDEEGSRVSLSLLGTGGQEKKSASHVARELPRQCCLPECHRGDDPSELRWDESEEGLS